MSAKIQNSLAWESVEMAGSVHQRCSGGCRRNPSLIVRCAPLGIRWAEEKQAQGCGRRRVEDYNGAETVS
jgi:hypothetical protein